MTELPPNPEDSLLVRAALAREPGAIERLVERLRCVPRILRSLNARRGRRLGEHDMADLVQDTMTIVLGKLGAFPAGASLEGWGYRICTYELMNALRRHGRAHEAVDESTWNEQAAPAPEKQQEDDQAELHWAMELLETQEAAVIRLKCLEDETFEGVAKRLKLSLGTAKTRYYRGLRKLREILAKRYEEKARW